MQGPTKSTGRNFGCEDAGCYAVTKSAYDMYRPYDVPSQNEEAQRKGPQASAAHWCVEGRYSPIRLAGCQIARQAASSPVDD
jgi:hypothetical protein